MKYHSGRILMCRYNKSKSFTSENQKKNNKELKRILWNTNQMSLTKSISHCYFIWLMMFFMHTKKKTPRIHDMCMTNIWVFWLLIQKEILLYGINSEGVVVIVENETSILTLSFIILVKWIPLYDCTCTSARAYTI